MITHRAIIPCACLITLLGLAFSCAATGGVSKEKYVVIDRSTDCINIANHVAASIAGDANSLLKIVHSSEWGARYGMLKTVDPQTLKPEYGRIKIAEKKVRDHLATSICNNPRIDLAFLAYGRFVLFVEKPFPNEAERQEWISTSGGDMYAGPFNSFTLYQSCDFTGKNKIPDISKQATSVLIGVPICYDGYYVCVLYLRFKVGSAERY